MNYLMSQSFNINYYDYSIIEQQFIKKTYEIGTTYPFKWYEFINKIIGNKEVTYFKDTTMIINLLNLELSQVKILFEVLKEYLKNNLVKKILYKREYIIVHFHSLKTMEIFSIKNLWIAVCCYYMLRDENSEVEVFLRGVIQNETSKELVDLVVMDQNKTYLINVTNALQNKYDDSEIVYLYYDRNRNFNVPKDVKLLRFSFDRNQLLNNFEHLKVLEKISKE